MSHLVDRLGNNPTLTAASKRRLRRDGRRAVEDSDRVRASLHAPDPKLATKNPARVLPDVAGFASLSKNEIKRDTREIDKRSGLMSVVQSDSEDDGDSYVQKSMHPACPPESTLYKKRRRYVAWNSKPALMASDLQKCKAITTKSKEEFSSLERDEERWADCLEVARHKLNTFITSCQESNNRLRLQAKQLYDLVILECGPGLSVRKRRASQMRDILEELRDRQKVLESNISEYERIALAASHNTASDEITNDTVLEENASNGSNIASKYATVVHMAIDELDYPEDSMPCGSSSSESNDVDSKQNLALTVETDMLNTLDNSTAEFKERKDIKVKNSKRIRDATLNGDDDDGEKDLEDEEDSDGECDSGNIADFCAVFALVDASVRLGEASLADLDPFFSDDEGEEGSGTTALGAKSGISKSTGGSGLGKASSAAGKALAASQKAATLKAAGVWDSSIEYQRECKLAEPFFPHSDMKEKDMHWAQCIADASQCPDLINGGSAQNQAALRRTRLARGTGSSAVTLSAHLILRTPRGVPLIISPLSQYEDRYLGVVNGGLERNNVSEAAVVMSSSSLTSTAATGPSSPTVTSPSPKNSAEKKISVAISDNVVSNEEILRQERQDAVPFRVPFQLPANLIVAEDVAMERCRLQSLAAAAENKIKRLKVSNVEWYRQVGETATSLQKSNNLFAQALKDDVTEAKYIRRELLTYGIIQAKDTDPPLSPVGEYPMLGGHVIGKKGGGAVNRKGVRSVRGLNFAVANAALSSSPMPPFGGPFGGEISMPLDAAAVAASMVSFGDPIVRIDEVGVDVDDQFVADDEEMDDPVAALMSQSEIQIKAEEKTKPKGARGKGSRKGEDDDGINEDPPEDEEIGQEDSPLMRKRGVGGKGAISAGMNGNGTALEGAANVKRRGATGNSSVTAPTRRR